NYKSPDAEVVRAMLSADTVLNALVVRKGARPPAVKRAGYTNPDFAPPDVFSISERTGGEAAEGLGKVGELFPKMIERVRSRYFIQYPAPHAEAGAFRRVRVELTPAARRKYPEAEWKTQHGTGQQASVPAHRYLVVHLSATNGGAETVSLPPLMLTDDSGQVYGEAPIAGDIPAALGLVRTLKPADTLDGRVLFD